ncbi:MAG: peroxiredoxin [Candidatus Bathyarchaeia archaeon]|jgi:peroxiredoxin (alkyl hydroperoxide reductase subunit C)
MEEKCEQAFPKIGDKVPDFEAATTQGNIKLSNFKGKWVIVFSHPADFTPVCTTEFVAFANINEELKKRNVQLIGLSIDSLYSHIAWLRRIKEKLGVDIPFPVIADLDMKVAKLFGVIHPGESTTSAIRCVFFIDPEMTLRAMVYYPLNVGRNMDEILRVLIALQTADTYKVAMPANWRPGDKVIVPPPNTMDAAEKRSAEGFEYIDWFLCKKELTVK